MSFINDIMRPCDSKFASDNLVQFTPVGSTDSPVINRASVIPGFIFHKLLITQAQNLVDLHFRQ